MPNDRRQVFFHRRQVVSCCRLDVELRVGSKVRFFRRTDPPPTAGLEADQPTSDSQLSRPAGHSSQEQACPDLESSVRAGAGNTAAGAGNSAAGAGNSAAGAGNTAAGAGNTDRRKGPEATCVYVDIYSDQGTREIFFWFRHERAINLCYVQKLV